MTTLSVAAYLNWNYLYPQYIYPWNNFFRRIQSTPFYAQNELNIITTREVQSPLIIETRPTLVGDLITDTYTNFITNLFPLNQAKVLLANGVKQFVGRYIDKNNLSGLEYQYTYTHITFIPSPAFNSSSTVLVFGLNLGATPNSPVDNKMVFTFSNNSSGTSSLEPAINGSLFIDDTNIVLDNFAPLPTVFGGWSDLDSSKQFFLILGNRIYIVVFLDPSILQSSQLISTNITLNLTARIVESVRTSITTPSLLIG
jgi:hypothetical protein